MVTFIIVLLILAYSVWAIHKIIINKKRGKCCGRDCANCLSKNNCS